MSNAARIESVNLPLIPGADWRPWAWFRGAVMAFGRNEIIAAFAVPATLGLLWLLQHGVSTDSNTVQIDKLAASNAAQIEKLAIDVNKHFESVDRRFDGVDKRFDSMGLILNVLPRYDARLDALERTDLEFQRQREKRDAQITDILTRMQAIQQSAFEAKQVASALAEQVQRLSTQLNVPVPLRNTR